MNQDVTRIELQNEKEAETYLIQGFLLQKMIPPRRGEFTHIFKIAIYLANEGKILPPIGILADLYALVVHGYQRIPKSEFEIPGLENLGFLDRYEDYFLGRLPFDSNLNRAIDAIHRLGLPGMNQKKNQTRSEYEKTEESVENISESDSSTPKSAIQKKSNSNKSPAEGPVADWIKAFAYLIEQIRQRCRLGGVTLSPPIIRKIAETSAPSAISLYEQGINSIRENGFMPLLETLYQEVTSGIRHLTEVLAIEDVIALEQGTALNSLGQYVAHRQILQHAQKFANQLKPRPFAVSRNYKNTPSYLMDEDHYPVGGYSSISNKGSIESLLHSQLAFMENDTSLRPDLFDIKLAREELYYYARDENQFFVRRRTLLILLFPDLVKARFKDANLPAQRIVMLLASLVALVQQANDWFPAEAITIELLFVTNNATDETPLKDEKELLAILLKQYLDRNYVSFENISIESLEPKIKEKSIRSLVQLLCAGFAAPLLESKNSLIISLSLAEPIPTLWNNESLERENEEILDPFDAWIDCLQVLLNWLL